MNNFVVNPSQGFITNNFKDYVIAQLKGSGALIVDKEVENNHELLREELFYPLNNSDSYVIEDENEENWLESKLKWESSNDSWTTRGNKYRKYGEAYLFKNEDDTIFQALVNWATNPSKRHGYLAPKNIGDVPYFPSVSASNRLKMNKRFNLREEEVDLSGSFWGRFEEYSSLPLVITEGAKKCLALINQGIPAISLFGCYCGVEKTVVEVDGKKGAEYHLKETLKRFCKPGRHVIIALDNDASKPGTKRKVAIAQSKLYQALKSDGCKPSIMNWSADYKGVDDLIVGNNSHFEERFEDALYPPKKSTIMTMRELILTNYGSRIKYNLMTQKTELDGVKLSLNNPKTLWNCTLELAGEFNSSDIVDAICGYALERSYHPVQEYLKKLEKDNSVEPFPLDKIASKFLGVQDDFSALLIKKWLISAVARVCEPGCQVDTILILQGSMGLQKSKFFRSLVKDASWFSSGVSSSKASEKDQKITLHSGWLHDLGEVGSIYRKKEIQELRQFITSTHDEFRPPYARESEVFARRFVFCGTANENDFMADSYGSRRWWIVPVSKKIAIPSSSEVDAIWKSALESYQKGEQWWLTDLEDAMNSRKNLAFYGEDPWTAAVIAIARENGNQVSMNALLDGLRLETTQRTRKETDRIASILRLNGYNNNKRDRCRNRIWALIENTHTSGICVASHDNSEIQSQSGFQELNNQLTQDENTHTSGRCGTTCGNTKTQSQSGFQELNNQLPHLNDKSIGIQYTSFKKVIEETNVGEPTHQNNKEVMEETKNEKMYQVHTFFENPSGYGGENTSNPLPEPVFDVPHVSGNTSGNGKKMADPPIKIDWKEEFYGFQSVKFLLDGSKHQGRLDDQKQEIVYAVPSKNKLSSVWYRVSVKQVELIG